VFGILHLTGFQDFTQLYEDVIKSESYRKLNSIYVCYSFI
jgi:hypothetical protein